MATGYTDCGIETGSRACIEHNVRDCFVCIKRTGACGYGGCHRKATHRATWYAPAPRGQSARILDVRKLCERHAEDAPVIKGAVVESLTARMGE